MKCEITIHDVESSEYAVLAETLARAAVVTPHCANIDIYCQERAVGDDPAAYRCVIAVRPKEVRK